MKYAALTLFLAATATAQQPWQHLQMPTAAEVARTWVSPPPEYGPEPYYGLNGPVTLETVRHDLDTMKSLGFQAVTVQAGRGMLEPYLSPEYFAFFKQLVAEASQRNMRVWIVDDIGYPSGFAGGKFSTEKPELRMQALAITQRIPVRGGAHINLADHSDAVAAVAVTTTNKRIPILVSGGRINWTAAEDATIFVVEPVFRTSPTRSDTNPTRLKDSTQSLEDYLNPAATAQYLTFTHQQYFNAMPEEFGKTILGFRGDEPDYSIAGLPWTPGFFNRFESVKHYDIRPYLVAILAAQPARNQPAMPLSPAETRARADYYDVFSQLFRDGFFTPQAEWCAAHKVEYQVHLNHEEMELQLVRSEGEFFRDMQAVQVPGIDSIWHQIWTDTISDFPRLAASAAHVYGHPRAFTETFAAYRPEPDVTMARYILNEQIVRGVNLVETMYYPSSATPPSPPPPPPTATVAPPVNPAQMLHGGPSALMRDPAWPALMAYVRRLTYVMSMGRPAAEVALYLPSSSLWFNDTAADTAFVATEQMLSERQIDFDIINTDALAHDLKAGTGTLENASGNSYRTIILPSLSVITQQELDRLQAFAKGGGKVLFLGRTPSLVAKTTFLDARAATPQDFNFATVEIGAQLPRTPTPPDQPPAAPPAPQIVAAAIEKAVDAATPSRLVKLTQPDHAVRLITRRLADADVLLFFNEGPAAIQDTLVFRDKIRSVDQLDPQTGKIARIRKDQAAKLDLQPYETRLLIVQ
jgi:hypothetical protein